MSNLLLSELRRLESRKDSLRHSKLCGEAADYIEQLEYLINYFSSDSIMKRIEKNTTWYKNNRKATEEERQAFRDSWEQTFKKNEKEVDEIIARYKERNELL